MAADFDIVQAAGGPRKAVRRRVRRTSQVDDWLTIELVAKSSTTSPAALPLLYGVELQRQRFTQPGCTPPAFVVNRFEPEKSGEIKLVNRCDEPFSGRLTLGAIPGLEASWQEQPIQLVSGQRLTVPLQIKALVPEGVYDLPLRLTRTDGTPAGERIVRIEHLGTKARVVLKAVEDAHVQQRYAGRNSGTVGVLLVDGGNQAMGDADHAVALLRFSLDLPGKPVRARLRLVNAGNATGDAGRICLVESPWEELKVTYQTRPKLGPELAKIGPMVENQAVERELVGDIPQKGEFSVAIDPTSTDGVDYLSRESGRPAELIVEYEGQP